MGSDKEPFKELFADHETLQCSVDLDDKFLDDSYSLTFSTIHKTNTVSRMERPFFQKWGFTIGMVQKISKSVTPLLPDGDLCSSSLFAAFNSVIIANNVLSVTVF